MKKENNISEDRKKYLRKQKTEKLLIKVIQFSIVIGFIVLWEVLANKGIIDSFITSQPSRIVKTFLNLSSNNLIEHIKVTCLETLIGFLLGTFLGAVIAIMLWWSKFLSKVSEPFLVVLNSLPKVALRTSYNHLGRSRNGCNYNYGINDFTNSNNTRNTKWLFEHRQRTNKNGTNISCKQISNINTNNNTSK
jgi:ABC-type Fe3+ transport system permease subunit